MFYGKRFYASSFHPLLLVKDFNSRGSVKRNKEFMSLNDVPYLAMKKLLKGINPYTKNPIKKREKKLPFRVIWAPWRMDQQKKHTFKVTQEYEISKANIFNVQNWKVVKK